MCVGGGRRWCCGAGNGGCGDKAMVIKGDVGCVLINGGV